MTETLPKAKQPPGRLATIHRWIRRGFIAWAVLTTAWFANSVRTQGVDPALLHSDAGVRVISEDATLGFIPAHQPSDTGLVFICGSGIAAEAYAPLLRPIAEEGHTVFIVRLPLRFAPLESHKEEAIRRVKEVMQSHPEQGNWVISGHSLGAALACRAVQAKPLGVGGLVLLGTTHPKESDLSGLAIPVTKVYASHDRIAPPAKVLANKALLPASTTWIEIAGGNHSQFGHYGHQFLDGSATISRRSQQEIARSALLNTIIAAGQAPAPPAHTPESASARNERD